MESRVYKRVLRLSWFIILITPNISYAESYIEKAEQFKKQQNLYKSNYYYISSIMNKQDLEQAHYGLAENRYSAREYPQALSNLEEVLAINPGNVPALILQARIFDATGDNAALSAVASKLETLPYQDEPVLRALDSAHSTLGNQEKARKYSNKRLENIRERKQSQITTGRTKPGRKRD